MQIRLKRMPPKLLLLLFVDTVEHTLKRDIFEREKVLIKKETSPLRWPASR
jgi:hypothetical protein